MSILSQILAEKMTEVDCAKRRRPQAIVERDALKRSPAKNFVAALTGADRPALIAEVKKASPSKGIIRHDFDPVAAATAYAANGASCISVLTDEPFFQGHLRHLAQVRDAVDVPLLRKDFIVDEYQIFEARAAGADAVLLIAAALKPDEIEAMLQTLRSLQMCAIVEVHNREELEAALSTSAELIGINNRDLHLFRTTLDTTIELMPHVPAGRHVISESGVNTRADVLKLRDAGVTAVLVGEALMREADIGAKTRELLGR